MARRWTRVVRWLIAVLAVKLVFVAAAAWWLFTTESGLARTVALLESLDAVTIRVRGATGRLIGPLHADSIEIDHRRAVIRIEGLDADVEPSELLALRIAAEDVRIGKGSIRVLPRTGPPKPAAFMARWLTLAIGDAAVGSLDIESPGGARLALRDVHGEATITRQVIEFQDARADAGSWAVAGASGRLLAREPVAIEGTAAWSLASTREVVGVGRALGDLDRLAVIAEVAKPGKAHADAELTQLTGDLRWTGKLRIDSLDLNQWTTPAPFGPLRGDLEGRGDRYRYEARGVVHGAGLAATGVPVIGTASWRDGTLTWHDVQMTLAERGLLHLKGEMVVSDAPSYDLHFDWTGLRWPQVGDALLHAPEGELHMQGWREFEYQVAGRFEPRGLPPAKGSASGRFTATQMIVDRSTWQTMGGSLDLRGTLSRDARRDWTASGRAQGLDPATIRDDLPGRLGFRYTAAGTGLDPVLRWELSVAGLGGKFRGQPASGGGSARWQDGSYDFERIALALGPARLALHGRLAARATSLDASLDSDDLSVFLPELGGSIHSELRMRASAITLAFIGHDLRYGDQRALILSADAFVDREDRVESWLRLRTGGLKLAGQNLSDTRLSMDGRHGDHRVAFRMGRGADAVELQGRGAWANRAYTLDTTSITGEGPLASGWRLESPSRFAASADRADLQPACFIAGSRRVCVDGRWQRGRDWAFSARTDDFPLEALQREVPGEPHFRGLLAADARFAGSATSPWIADVRAELRDARLEYRSASGQDRSVALGRTLLTLASTAERHALSVRLSEAAETEFAADLVAARPPGVDFAELPVTGSVHCATRQLVLLPLFLPDIDLASGSLTADFRVAGRVAAPRMTGEARLADGVLDFYQANLRLRDLDARLALQESGLTLRTTGRAGDGTLALDGRLEWHERRLAGELSLKGERLLLVDVPEARVFASPDIHMAIDGRRIHLTGSVEVPEARITPADTANAVLVSADERIASPEEPGQEDPFEVTSDVRLVLGDRVNLDAYGLSGRITGAVRARNTLQSATVANGELEVRNGKYRAYSRQLDVERGRLLFTGGPVTDPGVDLRASRKVPGYKVGVLVRGLLRLPQLTLFSEPPLPQTQIASLLLVGQTFDTLQADDSDSAAAERAALMAQGGALLAGPLGRQIGLDEVGVAQDAQNGTALVLGKFLSPRFYVSYGVSLVDQINTLKLRYTIGDRWVLSAESGREAAVDIEYRIEK